MAMRVGRNSIPKVNPNPRPPNEPRFKRNDPIGFKPRALGRAHALPPRQQGVGIGKALPGPQRPGGSATAPSQSPPPSLAPPIDPRDSQYWKDVAQLKFDNDIAGGNLDVEEAFEKSAYDREKAARDYAKPLEVQHEREGANVSGTIYSTSHQENLGNLAQEQFGKDATALENYQYALSQRIKQRGESKSGFERAMAELLEGATERDAENEINRPSLADEESNPLVAALEGRLGKGKGKGKTGTQSKFQRGASIGGKAAKGGSTGRGGGTNAPKGSNKTTNVNAGRPAQQKKKK